MVEVAMNRSRTIKIGRDAEYPTEYVQDRFGIIQEMEPKVSYYDIILRTKNAVPITLIAKDYGMSATQMNRILHALGIQYRVGGTWMLYQKYAGEGYTVTHTYIIDPRTSRMHTCWTQKGRLFLYDLLCDHGIYPVMERS